MSGTPKTSDTNTNRYCVGVKQAKSMSSMFEAFPTAKYKFEIPRYSGQEKLRS